MNLGYAKPAGMFPRTIAFGIDFLVGTAIVFGLLFGMEHLKAKKAFDPSKHYELADTGVIMYYRNFIDSAKESELDINILQRGLESGAPVSFAIVLFLPWLLFTLMHMVFGASLGKLLTGLRVKSEDGKNISAGKASVRYFSKWISGILLLLGFIMAFTNTKRQGLHDKLNKTIVSSK
jgi:uncharacterized RDD family membrane protein YckC